MWKFDITRHFDNDLSVTQRSTAVMRMFGVDKERLRSNRRIHSCSFEAAPGDVVYITGASGEGKSVLLREIQNQFPTDERIAIDDIELPGDRAVIDCIGFTAETAEKKNSKKSIPERPAASPTLIGAMRLLSDAGLSEVYQFLTPPAKLSEGQKYRFRLACCLASGKKIIFADEFCSNLDRITAGVIAYNVRRFAARHGVTFFLASSHNDILADLQPDVLVVKNFTGPAEVTYKTRTVTDFKKH